MNVFRVLLNSSVLSFSSALVTYVVLEMECGFEKTMENGSVYKKWSVEAITHLCGQDFTLACYHCPYVNITFFFFFNVQLYC